MEAAFSHRSWGVGLPLIVHMNTAVLPAITCWMVGVASTIGRAARVRKNMILSYS